MVGSFIHDIDIPASELPSRSTALRFADIGNALTFIQIEQELSSRTFDLHMNGTSRDKKDKMGYQASFDNGQQLSLGGRILTVC